MEQRVDRLTPKKRKLEEAKLEEGDQMEHLTWMQMQRLDELNSKSRKLEEAEALRRYQATSWLSCLVGPLGIPEQPSEKEFILCLRNGLILCKMINKIQPGSVKIIEAHSSAHSLPLDSQPLTTFQNFGNTQQFIVAMQKLKLPVFEASILDNLKEVKEGSSSEVVDCILALKDYHEQKQEGEEEKGEDLSKEEEEKKGEEEKGKEEEEKREDQSKEEEEKGEDRMKEEEDENGDNGTQGVHKGECRVSIHNDVETTGHNRAWARLTWEISYNFLRKVMGVAAFICCTIAMQKFVSIADRQKEAKSSRKWLDLGAMSAMCFMPLSMYAKHYVIFNVIPKRTRTRRYCKLMVAIFMILLSSLSLVGSVKLAPTKDGNDGLKLLGLLLGAIVLCEAAMLDNDTFGIFEMIAAIFLMQICLTFPTWNFFCLCGIAIFFYFVREVVMYMMRKMKEQVEKRKKREDKVKEEMDRQEFIRCWTITEVKLRNLPGIVVEKDFSEFMKMRSMARIFEDKASEAPEIE